ncbi:T9SS type B sorting domain-containing protein [Moheibacter sediminis]|uniref:T9SS type B sorting domain-containing protein n=1 Tax=Moheibacter sediminis TaxID=1434700 RepID=UPI0013566976|nr:choice-of-anchor L domain-containing protein [Moheibacter sediminis]
MPSQLVKEILLEGGECSGISNFQLKDNTSAPFPNPTRSWGYFERGNSDFPFEKGIVLTSGFAIDAIGPSEQETLSKGNRTWLGDADAEALAGVITYNSTVFEFDFVPQGNTISFNYIFASEEYPEWACSQYNDVFGFIISGPGIVNDPGLSGKNIALLPNGNPVTINNVNDQECGDDTYYVGGDFQDIGYDGRTTPLTAFAEVIPGQTYHIRLLVSDSGDERYDSAVFLEAGSFNLGLNIVDEQGIDVGENKYICGVDSYTLYIDSDNPSLQLQWYKDGNSIPGANSNLLTVSESGFYSINAISETCSQEDGVTVLFDAFEINAGEDFSLCSGEAWINLEYDILGEMTFQWQLNGEIITEATSDSLLISQHGTYVVTAYSSLGCIGTDSVMVSEGNGFVISNIEVGVDYIMIRASGGEEPYQYSIDGSTWQSDNYFYDLPSGDYTAYARSADGCIASKSFSVFNIPTLFTPNGDGINDTWRIKGVENYPNSQISIFDRHGRNVYESHLNSNEIWNGFFKNGKKAPTQDYWYILKIANDRTYSGTITVKSRSEKGM